MDIRTDDLNISIVDGNEIIQKYMGLPTTKRKSLFSGGETEEQWSLKYHEDWNVLMNVGKKIREEIRTEQNPQTLAIWMVMCSGLQNFDIEKTWKSFILYINFLNSLKN